MIFRSEGSESVPDRGDESSAVFRYSEGQAGTLPAKHDGVLQVPVTAGGSVPKPPLLAGVPIPTGNTTVRRRTLESYWRDEIRYQQGAPRRLSVDVLPLVVGMHDKVLRRRRLAKRLDRLGELTDDGKPRAILDKLVLLDRATREDMDRIGLTPLSAARLGLDVVRGRDLASQMARDDG